jgi:hypothetical protein
MGVTNQAECESLCSVDTGCKGYALLEKNPISCQLATTSSCPDYRVTSRRCIASNAQMSIVGQLDPNAQCGVNGIWNGGCMIKSGTILYVFVFSEITMLYSYYFYYQCYQ